MFDILSLLTIKSDFKAMLTSDLLSALLTFSDKPAYMMEVIPVILNLVRDQDYDLSPSHLYEPGDHHPTPSTLISAFDLQDLSTLLSSSHLRSTPLTALTDLPLLAEHGTTFAAADLRRLLILDCQLLPWIMKSSC